MTGHRARMNGMSHLSPSPKRENVHKNGKQPGQPNETTTSPRGASRLTLMLGGIILGATLVIFIGELYALSLRESSLAPRLQSVSLQGTRGSLSYQQDTGEDSRGTIRKDRESFSAATLRQGLTEIESYLGMFKEDKLEAQTFMKVVRNAIRFLDDNERQQRDDQILSSKGDNHTTLRETVQTCYLQSDESELCVYTNMCFDGQNMIVVVDDEDTRQQRDRGYITGTIPLAQRNGESSQHEALPFDRMQSLLFTERDPSIDYPKTFESKQFGPVGSGFTFRKIHPDYVFTSPDRATSSVRGHYCKVPFNKIKRGNSLKTLINTKVPSCNGTIGNSPAIEWLNSTTWWVHLEQSWDQDPFYWSTKVFPLFDAMRSNYTPIGSKLANPWYSKLDKDSLINEQYEAQFYSHHDLKERFESDEQYEYKLDKPYMYSEKERKVARRSAIVMAKRKSRKGQLDTNRLRWQGQRLIQYTNDHSLNRILQKNSRYGQTVVGTQWSMPAMDYVAFRRGTAAKLPNPIKHASFTWGSSMLTLILPNHTKTLHDADLARYSSNRLFCSRKAVITGQKPQIFTGLTDAWIFRQYGYQYAGLLADAHPHHPPRKILFLTTEATHGNEMRIENEEEVVLELRKTGLPVKTIPNMKAHTFKQQVNILSQAGILVSLHSSELINAMFLPQHAAIIEIYPDGLKHSPFAELSRLMGIHYFRLPSFENMHASKEKASYPTNSTKDCGGNTADGPCRENRYVQVSAPLLSSVLDEAVDMIGAYSVDNVEWRTTGNNPLIAKLSSDGNMVFPRKSADKLKTMDEIRTSLEDIIHSSESGEN